MHFIKRFFKSHGIIFFFLLIFLLSLFFRLYNLASDPPSIHIDELPFGYNAYSILQTGRDEYGTFLPIVLRAYDDYRTALFSYLAIPFIKVFGLNIVSIRLVSVVLSCITLIAVYQITIALLIISSIKKKNERLWKKYKTIALCTIFLYSISPWNIFLSRLAIDTNVGLTFFSLALWMFLEYILSKKTWKIFISFLFFALSFYGYNGIKFFLLFFVVALCLFFYHSLWQRKKVIVMVFLFFVILISPSLGILSNATNLNRFTYLDFFTQEQSVVLASSSQRLLYDNHNLLGKFFDNRRITIIPLFVSNYLTNIDPTWLYADDYTHEKYKVPDFGLFYLFEFPLLILGIYFVIKEQILSKKVLMLLLVWIAFSIVPAALTIDTPSAVRIYTALPAFLILEGCGLYFITQYILEQNFIKKILSGASLFAVMIVSVLWFFHAYFMTFPYEQSQAYSYGVTNALAYANEHEKDYKHILVSNRGDLTFSYLYYLFTAKYDPKKYLENGGTKSGSFSANHIIGKYAFVNPSLYLNVGGAQQFNPHFFNKNTLYIVDDDDIPLSKKNQKLLFQKVKVVKLIHYLNGQDAIFILSPIIPS